LVQMGHSREGGSWEYAFFCDAAPRAWWRRCKRTA
jgi:hypothetical protein